MYAKAAASHARQVAHGCISAHESGRKRAMELVPKMAWLALPALAGSVALSQVTHQGTGADPGTQASRLAWNGEPVSEEDLAQLTPESDGTVRVPVVDKYGKVDPFWKLDSVAFVDQPIEAGKAPSLSVGAADAKTRIIVSKLESIGKLSSKKCEITSDMKKLQMRIIGNGDMTSTYVRLLVSIDGKAPIGWAQQAPTSARIFEKLEWDLSKVLEAGKSVAAQIDIVDGSKAQVIGIGEVASITNKIDPVAGASSMPWIPDSYVSNYILNPNVFGFEPKLINFSGFLFDANSRRNGRELPVGLNPLQFDVVINEVYKRTLIKELDHYPGMQVDDLAKMLGNSVDFVMSRYALNDKPSLLREWLLAEAVCAWVSTRVVYDNSLVNAPANLKISRAQPQSVLDQSPASGICSGQSALTTALARKLGLDATHLGGEAIFYGERKPTRDNHGWVFFNFGDGIFSAADVSQGAMSLSDMRRIGGKMNWDYLLPKSPLELELFLSKHYAYGPASSIDESKYGIYNVNIHTKLYAMHDMPLAEWHKIDTN